MDVQQELGLSLASTDQVVLIPQEYVDTVWPQVEEFFEQGAPYWEEYCDLEVIRQALREGRSQLWLATVDATVKLVGLTEFSEYPKMKVLRITWIAGSNVRQLKHLLEVVELWAQTRDVTRIEFLGRAGWLRVLHKENYRFHSYLVVKDLVQMTEH